MAIYLGCGGSVELQRSGGVGAFTTVIDSSDINATARRFTFEDSQTRLITGDRVMITTSGISAGTNLDFIAPSAWASGVVEPSFSAHASVDDIGGIRLYGSFAEALENDPANAVQLVNIGQGHSITITVDPVSSSWRPLAQVRQYEVNTNVETIDTSALGDEFRSSIDSIKTGNGRLSCEWDYSGTGSEEIPYYLQQLIVRTQIGQKFRARLYLKTQGFQGTATTQDDSLWYEFDAVIVAAAVQFTPGTIVEMTIEFIATGQIQLAARTIPRGTVNLQGNTGAIALSPNSGGGAVLLSTAASTAALPAPPTPFIITLSSSLVTSGNTGSIGDIYKVQIPALSSPAIAVNQSPDLSWSTSGTPASAVATWRLRCYDRAGSGSETIAGWAGSWIHWKVDNIPSGTTSIAQNGAWPSGVSVVNNDWIVTGQAQTLYPSVATTNYQLANGWGGPLPNGHTYEIYVEAINASGALIGRSNILSLTSVTP